MIKLQTERIDFVHSYRQFNSLELQSERNDTVHSYRQFNSLELQSERNDTVMRIVQLMTDRSRYFNPSKNYWFSFNAFLISLIGLYFRCLSFRVVLVNTTRPDGAFLFVV